MANNGIQPPKNTGQGLVNRTWELVETAGPFAGQNVERTSIIVEDPITGTPQKVGTLHTGDNAAVPAAATDGSALMAAFMLLLNASGKLDRIAEAGADGVTNKGMLLTALAIKNIISTTCSQNVNASAASVNLLVGSSVGFVVGGAATIDTGANKEVQVITAIPDATHITVDHLNTNHNGTVTAFTVTQGVYSEAKTGFAGNDLIVSGGGIQTTVLNTANVSAGNVTVKASAGRVCKLLVSTVTAGADLVVTDGNGGNIIAIIPSGTAKGTIVTFDMPALTSIFVAQQGAFTGSVTMSWV